MGRTAVTYSVFISYSSLDKHTCARLKKELEREGIKVYVDEFSINPGANLRKEIRSLIAKSDLTVCLISSNSLKSLWVIWEIRDLVGSDGTFLPAYLDKNFMDDGFVGGLQNQINDRLESLKSEMRKRLDEQRNVDDLSNLHTQLNSLQNDLPQVVGKLRDTCVLDLTDEGFQTGFQKLYQQITGQEGQHTSPPPPGDLPIILSSVKAISDKIELLYGLKKLHDELHNIQIDFYNPTKNLRFGDGHSISDDELLDLEDAEQTFKYCVELLWTAAAGIQKLKPDEGWSAQLNSWIERLEVSHTLFKEGMVERDLQKIQRSLNGVSRVMTQTPTKINTRLSSVASNLELTGVITTLRSASTLLGQGGDGAETINQIQRNIDKLEQLHVEIKELVAKHDAWQELDDQLRRIVPLGNDFDQLLDELKASWVDLQSSVIQLFPAEAEEPLPSSIREFFDLLKDNDEEVDPNKLRRNFIKFLKVAGQRFNTADKKLRQGFDDARNLASTLQESIRERVER